MAKGTTARLSIMMFLQFFVWGGWYVTIGNYMTAVGMNSVTHWAYTVGPIAAIISPFFLGLVADRFFSVEKVLGVKTRAGRRCRPAPGSGSPWPYAAATGRLVGGRRNGGLRAVHCFARPPISA